MNKKELIEKINAIPWDEGGSRGHAQDQSSWIDKTN